MKNQQLYFQVFLSTQHFFIDISKKKFSEKSKISIVYKYLKIFLKFNHV